MIFFSKDENYGKQTKMSKTSNMMVEGPAYLNVKCI